MQGTTLRLVRPVGAPAATVAAAPAFLDAGARLCPGPLPARAGNALARHLGYKVARRPDDLLSHTHRVLLHCRLGQGAAAYGALLDLYHVLGERGAALRQRLLNAADPLLDPGQRALLRIHLRAGRAPLEPGQTNVHCRLARPCSGLHLVRRAGPATPPA